MSCVASFKTFDQKLKCYFDADLIIVLKISAKYVMKINNFIC